MTHVFTAVRRHALAAFVAFAAAPGHAQPSVTGWQPPGISTPAFESHLAVDPRSDEVLFVRSTAHLEDWRVMSTHCTSTGWALPRPWALAADGFDADPWFTPDGTELYFISTRGHPGGTREAESDIWHARRLPSGGWQAPRRLPAPVNAAGREWLPRVCADSWLYFGSDRKGGRGRTDIWRARENRRGHWRVENVAALNTPGDEYEAALSPDGHRMLVTTTEGLLDARRHADGWQRHALLPAPINGDGLEVGPVFSPSGRTVVFSRPLGERSGEFMRWQIAPEAPWPADCPAPSPSH